MLDDQQTINQTTKNDKTLVESIQRVKILAIATPAVQKSTKALKKARISLMATADNLAKIREFKKQRGL